MEAPVTTVTVSEYTHQAYMILLIAFIVAPMVAGIDKHFNVLTDWTRYLAPIVPSWTGLAASTFMMIVGAVEILAGLIVAFKLYLNRTWRKHSGTPLPIAVRRNPQLLQSNYLSVQSVDRSTNGQRTNAKKVSLEELMVSTLAMADATVKCLIAKGVFTDDEFKAQLSTERANYRAVLKRLN